MPPTHRKRGGFGQLQPPRQPLHNAQAEASWGMLKTELLPYGTAFASLKEAYLGVTDYLDTYFNLDRRRSALGYCSPPPIRAKP